MSKIRITQPTFDASTNEKYEVGRILDLGPARNRAAVDSLQAVYVDEAKLQAELKATGKKDDVSPIVSEKVQAPAPKGGKAKVNKAGGKVIETKGKDA